MTSLEKAGLDWNTEVHVYNDGDTDEETIKYLACDIPKIFYVKTFDVNQGLRAVIIDFLESIQSRKIDFIAKIDNDCTVPNNAWLDKIIRVMDGNSIDIASPNVNPSNAAEKYGTKTDGDYYPTKTIGGLWVMRTELIKSMKFTQYDTDGLTGAISLLRQIVNERSPIMGWVPSVVVQDIGHWSGQHPDHIKSTDHAEYSYEVGREIAWNPEEKVHVGN